MSKQKIINKTQQPNYTRVSPNVLRFDPDNPRFGISMRGKSQEEIEAALMTKPYYASELLDSLAINGFIPYEPLVVKKQNGYYEVIEGNRRLAAVKYILKHPKEYQDTSRFNEIPVLEFSRYGGSAETVYLGVRHLFGFREWPPLSKALFLDGILKGAPDMKRLLGELGMERPEVKRYLIPYRALKKVDQAFPETADFWLLGEALTRSNIKNFISLEIDRATMSVRSVSKNKLELLLEFLYGKRIKGTSQRDPDTAIVSESRDLKDLNAALGAPQARRALEHGKDLETALLSVETQQEGVVRLKRLVTQLEQLLKDSPVFEKRQNTNIKLQQTFKAFKQEALAIIEHANS